MSATVCAVSGNIKDISGMGFAGAVITATTVSGFLHPDGTFYPNYTVSTTSDSNGDWTLNLVETETTATATEPSVSYIVTLDYLTGASLTYRKVYSIIVPNTSTALFKDLVQGQVN